MMASSDVSLAMASLIALHCPSNLYILLDHGGMPGLHRQLLKISARWVSLFEGGSEERALSFSPILVLVKKNGQAQISRRFLEWVLTNGIYESSITVFVSPLPFDVMKSRLSARLDVMLSGNLSALLRFFDTRVLQSILEVLEPAQLNQFLSVADMWIYVSRTGQLVEIPSCFNACDDSEYFLKINQSQEVILIEKSEVDQVMNLIEANSEEISKKTTSFGTVWLYKQSNFYSKT